MIGQPSWKRKGKRSGTVFVFAILPRNDAY